MVKRFAKITVISFFNCHFATIAIILPWAQILMRTELNDCIIYAGDNFGPFDKLCGVVEISSLGKGIELIQICIMISFSASLLTFILSNWGGANIKKHGILFLSLLSLSSSFISIILWFYMDTYNLPQEVKYTGMGFIFEICTAFLSFVSVFVVSFGA